MYWIDWIGLTREESVWVQCTRICTSGVAGASQPPALTVGRQAGGLAGRLG